MSTAGIPETTNTLAEIILVVIIIITFITFASQTTTSTPLETKYFSRELGMITTLVQASPGMLLVNYTPPNEALSRFNYKWQDNLVYATGVHGSPSSEYPYLRNTHLFSGGVELTIPRSIIFANNREKLNITTKSQELPEWLACPQLNFHPSKIFLDPGHGEEDDSGWVVEIGGSELVESQINCVLAREVSMGINKEVYSSRPLNDMGVVICQDTYRRPQEVIEQEAAESELVLGFHIENSQSNGAYIKAIVAANNNQERARYIACKLLDAIAEAFGDEVDGYAIVECEPGVNCYDVLNTNTAGVALVLGNIQSPASKAILTDYAKIAKLASTIAGVLNE
ncbi:hypothetical protein DRJ48_00240 [Candidatus Woesearchaeota archaeon]|nr:N-acetylmuramoyl-L-alanine amidase [Candidatus Woesearchaeota archaeon]RLE43678.1 MAG: hypothetical protein DRJ48_00240 [Candidatus Woesearchaeota archaeon]